MSLSFGGNKQKAKQNETFDKTESFTPNAEYLGMVRGGLDKALGLAGSFNPIGTEQIDAFRNPYVDDVAGRTSQGLARSRDMQANELSGKAAAAGAFGGSGWGLLQGENTRAFADAEADALAGINAQAYDRATQVAQSEEERRMQAQLASIQSYLGGLGLLGNWGTGTSSGTGSGTSSGSGFNWGVQGKV